MTQYKCRIEVFVNKQFRIKPSVNMLTVLLPWRILQLKLNKYECFQEQQHTGWPAGFVGWYHGLHRHRLLSCSLKVVLSCALLVLLSSQ